MSSRVCRAAPNSPALELPLAFRGLVFGLADSLVADAQEKACITRRVAGGADLRNRVAHCAGSGILRGAGTLPLTRRAASIASRTPPRGSRSGSSVMSNESPGTFAPPRVWAFGHTEMPRGTAAPCQPFRSENRSSSSVSWPLRARTTLGEANSYGNRDIHRICGSHVARCGHVHSRPHSPAGTAGNSSGQ